MKFLTWKIKLALALMGASAGLYGLNYLIFRDSNYMLRLFLAQLGFLPISVLLVTIILNQLLGLRAKAAKLAKLNMVIGAFFSEVGGALLKTLSVWDRHLPEFQQQVAHISHWTGPDFATFQPGSGGKRFPVSSSKRAIWRHYEISCCKSGTSSCACWKTPICWNTTPLPTCCWRSST